MIKNDKAQIEKELKLIDEALTKGGKIYKSCLVLTNFTTEIDKQIDNFIGQLAHISQAYDPTTNLTKSIEGQILGITKKIRNF